MAVIHIWPQVTPSTLTTIVTFRNTKYTSGIDDPDNDPIEVKYLRLPTFQSEMDERGIIFNPLWTQSHRTYSFKNTS